MRFPFFRNRDSVKNGILISIHRTGDGFHPGLFNNENERRNSLDNFKERIEAIRYAETVSEKANKAIELLSTTDNILKYDALSIFDGMKLNDEDNYFKRFLEYRSEASIEYK